MIPLSLRERLANNPFYWDCCISNNECQGHIEWHHNLIYAGKQVNEEFCILPLCQKHHKIEKYKQIKSKLNKIMVSRATDEDLKKFPKIDFSLMR